MSAKIHGIFDMCKMFDENIFYCYSIVYLSGLYTVIYIY